MTAVPWVSATATNNRKKDAPYYICKVVASSRLPQGLELRTFMSGNRDDFFAVDVIRHAACGYSIARSRSTPLVNVPAMPDGVHDNGVLRFEDFEDDAV